MSQNNPVPPWAAGNQPQPEQQYQAAQAAQAGRGAPLPPSSPPQAAESKGRGTRTPSGLALAGAGSILAVLAFLGGTAVGHAWGSGSAGNEQTQFGGPGGGRMRQFPGNQLPGQGTQQDPSQQGQGTQQNPVQPGQGTQQDPGQQQPGQTQTS